MTTKFYVEKPGDEDGNVGYLINGRMTVIEAIPNPDHDGSLVVVRPTRFLSIWPTVNGNLFQETYGPARTVDREEWCKLVGFEE